MESRLKKYTRLLEYSRKRDFFALQKENAFQSKAKESQTKLDDNSRREDIEEGSQQTNRLTSHSVY